MRTSSRFKSLPPDDRGFTLVELLVVVALIGVLVALLLPAIQSSRSAARRTTCANNLRQIGVALTAYHTARKQFPVGCVEWRPAGGNERQLAWSAFLLPFLDEQATYDRLDLSQAFDSGANAPAAAVVIPVYLCPGSTRVSPLVDGRGACDYGGIFGERLTSPNQPPKGVMLIDAVVTVRQIRDGTAKTLIVAEDSRSPDQQWISGRNIFDQAYAINAAPPIENDIRSEHAGGAHGTMADSSVHFLVETIDLRVLAALCTRAGQEAIEGF
jgi:prepilin-type N-terminal cleavage/methylation domain-containing protein